MNHSHDNPQQGDGTLVGPGHDGVPEQDNSPPIFHGSVSMWMGFRTFMTSFILALIGAAIAIASLFYVPGILKDAMLISGVALFLASAIMPIYVMMRIRSQRYTITRRLIEREQGVIMKKVDAIDLAKVKDVELSQSILERILNVGTIKVFSTDKTVPMMRIEAIPNPRPIYEQLRDAVIDVGRKRGVIGLDR